MSRDRSRWPPEPPDRHPAIPVQPAAPAPRTPGRPGTPPSGSLGQLALFVFAFGTLLLLIEAVYVFSTRRAPMASVAIVPFTPTHPSSQLLNDGLAESVIERLAPLPGLRVTPWNTAARWRGRMLDGPALGRLLNVRAILTVEVTPTGRTLDVAARLVDARRGVEIWHQQSRRPLADLPLLPGKIARDATAKLGLNLAAAEQDRLARPDTENAAAYEFYLRGRDARESSRPGHLQEAAMWFRQAVALDPRYARAYAGLADSDNRLGEGGFTAPRQSFPEAQSAARQALALDPGLAAAHRALAVAQACYEFDWRAAESEFQKALELDPNDAANHREYGFYLAGLGRLDEAMREMSRAQELDPLSPPANAGVAEIWQWSRADREAIRQYRKALRLDPRLAWALANLAEVYELEGMDREAREAIEKEDGSAPPFESALLRAEFEARAGRKPDAEKALAKLRPPAANTYVPASRLAAVYAALGDKDAAFASLDRAYEERDAGLARLEADPAFDPLRSDPRFAHLLARLGLPQGPVRPR